MDYVTRRKVRRYQHNARVFRDTVREFLPELFTSLGMAAAVFVLIPLIAAMMRWIF